jgi:hypothetical protein
MKRLCMAKTNSSDGREIPFHRKSVVSGAFDKLHRGWEVRLSEETGEQRSRARPFMVSASTPQSNRLSRLSRIRDCGWLFYNRSLAERVVWVE